jgi:hypothetical protein
MYSAFSYQIAQDRIADLHHEVQHDALARAACQARRTHKRQSGHRVRRLPFLTARRVRTA